MVSRQISIFSTCPHSRDALPGEYLRRVQSVARWSERSGCRGILIYANNSIVDPWLVAQHILASTNTLCPLVAVQPGYMHPFTAAKMVASLGMMYGRRIYLNMIAGGFQNDLRALNDHTPHDARYRRLTEYTLIVQQLLASDQSVTFEGDYYTVRNLRIQPTLSPELFPGIMISGSSPAGAKAAARTNATAIKYPERVEDEERLFSSRTGPCGVRMGIIARSTDDEAWQVAHQRYPAQRRGKILHRIARSISDSYWHRRLSDRARTIASEKNAYWLGPFENYHTFCPQLVGSYDRVAQELRGYMNIGHDTFILDIPASEAELEHIHEAFAKAGASGNTLAPHHQLYSI